MELWFSDYHTEKVKVSVKVQKQLFGLQTEFQRIDVFDSDEFGRFLSADGSIVFSEKDEFIYDEMVTHVPMAVHPHVKNVLIIGGGTAGCFAAYVIGKKSGRKVLIAEKANIKRSGCLAAGVNALNAYITEGRVPQDYVDYAKKDAHGIVREDLLLTMSERLNHVTKVMEDLGLVILLSLIHI